MQKQCAIGVDVGGTKVRFSLITDNGVILKTRTYSSVRGNLKERVNHTLNNLEIFLRDCPVAKGAIGVGFGIKGFVDSETMFWADRYPPKESYNVRDIVYQKHNLACVLDNDVTAATVAEMRIGAGKIHRYFTYVNLGTGLAIGVVDDGRLIRGKNNNMGECGCNFTPRRDTPNELFELEDVVSGLGMEQELKRLVSYYPGSPLASTIIEKGSVRSSDIARAYSDGSDELAKAVMNNFVHYLALYIINHEFTFNSQHYVFGGGVMKDAWILELVEKEVVRLSNLKGYHWTGTLETTSLGVDEVGVLGAASIVFQAADEGRL